MHNPRRTRTPAAIKWLLAEHAAVLGRSIILKQRSSILEKKLTKAEPAYLKLMSHMNKTESELQQCERTLDALKRSLAQLAPEVDPAAGGTVTPKLARYGEQGEFQKFLIATLQAAAPEAMTTSELTDLVIKTFNVATFGGEVRRSVRYSLTNTLRRLKRRGYIEALHTDPPEYSGIWRWKPAPTLTDLKAKAERIARETAEKRNAKPDAPIGTPANCTADAPANPDSRYPVPIGSHSAGKNTA